MYAKLIKNGLKSFKKEGCLGSRLVSDSREAE